MNIQHDMRLNLVAGRACPSRRRKPHKHSVFLLLMTILLGLGNIGDARAAALENAASPPADIGHGFELLATTGNNVTDTTYRGRWLIVYFGFTHCPDICPATLLDIGSTLKLLGSASDEIQPLFVTIDPERDTHAVMASYVGNFDRRIVGLTGSKAQVAQAAKAFGVSYSVRDTGDGNYLMSHSSFIFIVDPHGISTEVVPAQIKPQSLAQELRRLMQDASDVSFEDGNGRLLSLVNWRGRIVLLNVWASWCGPCLEELPGLDRLQAQRGGADFEVVALAIDRRGVPAVLRALQRTGAHHLNCYLDPSGDVVTTLGVEGLPTTLLINREGHEIARWRTPVDWSSSKIMAVIDEARSSAAASRSARGGNIAPSNDTAIKR